MTIFTAGWNNLFFSVVISAYCGNKHSAPLSKVENGAAEAKSGAVVKNTHFVK